MIVRKIVHILYFFASFLFPGLALYAQQADVTSRLDSTSILIGNQAHIRLAATYDSKYGIPKIQWPTLKDTLVPKIEIISKSKISTIIPDSSRPAIQQQIQDITISCFDSGYYAISPFQFIVNGDTAHPLLTQSMMLQVLTVPVDTSKAFKDIKAPIQVPFTILEILPYLGLGALALAIIGVILYYVIRRLRKQKPVIIEEPKEIIPPHIKALQELEKLALQKLWQEGKIKEYYTGITDILRTYIQERYGVGAPEMTTDEIMLALKRKDINEMMKGKLRDILVLADLVKFAKEHPIPSEHEYCFSSSIDFINETKEQAPEASRLTQPEQQNPVTA